MKKLLIIIALLGGYHHYKNQPGTIDADMVASLSRDDVILYSTSWCGYCNKARAFLIENDVPYTEYDIEKSKKGREQYDAIAKGYGVPVLDIKGRVVKGYSERNMRIALTKP